MMIMTTKGLSVLFPFLIVLFFLPECAHGANSAENQVGNAASGSAGRTAPDLTGTWSGTFMSKHSDARPFTITVVIGPDSEGALVGTSSLQSDCVRNPRLQVTIKSPKVVLAGSDADGNSIMFRGSLNSTGTLLTMKYIANGSASGRCETDNGTGTLGKR
jgi:hypothetical protein